MNKKKKNIVLRILTNTYFKNILLMVVIFAALIAGVLFALNIYTKHSESVSVPTVKGLQIEDAVGILRAADLRYEVIDSTYHEGVVPGAIVEQIPSAKSNVKRGRAIYLKVQAKGQQMVAVPSLKDYTRRQAEAQLKTLGFNKVIIVEEPSQYKGIVLSLTYKGKEVTPNQKIPKGAALKMTVGAGGEDSVDSTGESIPDLDKSFY